MSVGYFHFTSYFLTVTLKFLVTESFNSHHCRSHDKNSSTCLGICYFPLPNFMVCSATFLSHISGFALLLPSPISGFALLLPSPHFRICSLLLSSHPFQGSLCYFPLTHFRVCSATSLSPISEYALLLPSPPFLNFLCYFPLPHLLTCLYLHIDLSLYRFKEWINH